MLAFDRRQRGTFRKSFEEYTATRVNLSRVTRGRQMLQKHAQLLTRVETQYGVPKRIACGDLGAGKRLRRRRHGQAAAVCVKATSWRMIAAAPSGSRAS